MILGQTRDPRLIFARWKLRKWRARCLHAAHSFLLVGVVDEILKGLVALIDGAVNAHKYLRNCFRLSQEVVAFGYTMKGKIAQAMARPKTPMAIIKEITMRMLAPASAAVKTAIREISAGILPPSLIGIVQAGQERTFAAIAMRYFST